MQSASFPSYAPPMLAAVSAFSARFSPDERAAIWRLKVEHGRTGQEIATLAAGGIDGLPPFTVDKDSANRIARDEIRKRAELAARAVVTVAENDPVGAVRQLLLRLVAVADRLVAAQESITNARRIDVARLERAAGVLDRLAKTARTLQPATRAGTQGKPGKSEDAPPPVADDLLARLAREADAPEPPDESLPSQPTSEVDGA